MKYSKKPSVLLADIGAYTIAILVLWFLTTNIMQAIKCPSMTQTELLIHLPKTVVLDFQHETK